MFSSSTLLFALTSLLSVGSSHGRELQNKVTVTLFVRFGNHPEGIGFNLVDVTENWTINWTVPGTYTKPGDTIVVHYEIEDYRDYEIVMNDRRGDGMPDGWIAICPGKLSADDRINLETCKVQSEPFVGSTFDFPFTAQEVGYPGTPPPFPDCTDDEDATFFVNDRWGEQNCAWLRDTHKFQHHLCHYDHAAAKACQETCISCEREFDAGGDCVNDNDRFYINDNVGVKDCEWLATSPVHKRRHCQKDRSAHYVCRELCNSCDAA